MIRYLKNVFSLKCPRCHQGNLFVTKWYRPNANKMIEKCAVCGQRTELEPGFYHGTGYVSYALTVGFSIITFVVWVLLTGYGFKDRQIFWWLPLNIVALILLQPWLMRLSRAVWLSMFFHADDAYHQQTTPLPSKNKLV